MSNFRILILRALLPYVALLVVLICRISSTQSLKQCTFNYPKNGELREPVQINMHNNAKFHLHVAYCDNYKIYDEQIGDIAIEFNTRCYCFNYVENKNDIDLISLPKGYNYTEIINTQCSICSIPGPTFILHNNTEYDIYLHNDLIGTSYNPNNHNDDELRAYPDVTNLHTHGLHISPSWDNIFINGDPQTIKHLHFEVPSNHYPGTHWYHAHWHGSTDFQVQGGLYGAIIMETGTNILDDAIDVILEYSYIYTYDDCDCSLSADELRESYTYRKTIWEISSECYEWCINDKSQREESGFKYYVAPSPYANSHGMIDLALVNAQYQPTLSIIKNQWYRLRMINSNGQYYPQIAWPIDECEIYLIAADGIFFQEARDLNDNPYRGQIIMASGSRYDVMIKCSNSGDKYSVRFTTNIFPTPLINILPLFPNNQTIFTIQVIGDDVDDVDDPNHTNVTTVTTNINDCSNYKDMKENICYPPYTIPPYPEYLDNCIDSEDNCPWEILTECPCYTYDTDDYQCHFTLRGGRTINGQLWNASKPMLYVCKDYIYDFQVNSLHPLHIHTAPYTPLRDIPDGNDRGAGYIAKRGEWRDTLSSVDGDYHMRWKADVFDGPMVVHCHFLPHEDEGMINYFQVIDCVDPLSVKELNPFNYDPRNDINTTGCNAKFVG